MNIAAAMAALRLEVAPADKLALLVLAARAGRDQWTLTRSLAALAEDMGVSRATAKRAVHDLCRKGYLQVSHSVGISSTYTLGPPLKMTPVGEVNMTRGVGSNGSDTRVNMTPVKRKTGERLEGDARPLAANAAGVAGDNPAATWQPTPRPHPADCDCQGTGWTEDPTTREVTKCEP